MVGVEFEPEHTKGRASPDGARGKGVAQRPETAPTSPDDELHRPMPRIGVAVGVERLKTLVVMVVPAEDDVDAGPDQEAPDRLHRLEAPVLTRTPARMVPVRKRAPCWMGSEVRFQPLILWRLLVASTDRLAIRVQDDDVPFP